MAKSKHRCEIILYWSYEDDTYIAEVPELAGCAADGASYQEAIANVEVVIDQWIETARELDRPVPEPKDGRPDVSQPLAVRGLPGYRFHAGTPPAAGSRAARGVLLRPGHPPYGPRLRVGGLERLIMKRLLTALFLVAAATA